MFRKKAETPAVRRAFHVRIVDDGYKQREKKTRMDGPMANLISSATELPSIHLPVLDIDYPAQLVPSTQADHWHLYLDKPVHWDDYQKVLTTLASADLIEPGWADQAVKNKESEVRAPGTWKKLPADESEGKALIALGLSIAASSPLLDAETAAKMRYLAELSR